MYGISTFGWYLWWMSGNIPWMLWITVYPLLLLEPHVILQPRCSGIVRRLLQSQVQQPGQLPKWCAKGWQRHSSVCSPNHHGWQVLRFDLPVWLWLWYLSCMKMFNHWDDWCMIGKKRMYRSWHVGIEDVGSHYSTDEHVFLWIIVQLSHLWQWPLRYLEGWGLVIWPLLMNFCKHAALQLHCTKLLL